MFLLDGYEVTPENLVSLLTLPMNMVDRIDIINASPLYGMRGANGVINVITKTGIRRIFDQESTNSVTSIIKGFDIPRVFYSPKYDNKTPQTYTPDYRSTIFWEPDIKIFKNQPVKLEYYNADSPREIKIVVEGITEEGIPLTATTLYNIK